MNNLHSKVMARYEAIRKEEETRQKERKAEIYQRIPLIAELETQMSLNSLNVARVHLRDQDNTDREIARLKEENLNLRQNKMELLVSNGYPMDYMDLKHHCRKCNDSGFFQGRKCTCYNNLLAEIVYEESDFHEMLNDNSFETFDESLFDATTVHAGSNKTARQQMRENLEIARTYVRDFPIHLDNLYFYGPSGTGKTFLATSIAKALLQEGQVVVYRTASQLMEDIKDIKFRDNKELEQLLTDSDLLILDDLGTEMVTDLAKTEVFNLINLRLLHKKKMLISSNLSLGSIRDKYSERLSSRIAGEFILVAFFGDDLRNAKGQRKILRFRRRMK